MDLAELKAFLTVAETRSFSEAASSLFVTQPAVSKRIASLEHRLGVVLFDRIGRLVSLTEAGRALLPKAQEALDAVEEGYRVIARLSDEVSGVLDIATSHHVGLHHLPPILKQFTTDYPRVQLKLKFMDSEQACRAVEQGSMELAVVTLPSETSANLQCLSLWPDPMDIVVAREHELTRITQFTLADLSSVPAILPAAGTFTRALIDQAFSPLGIEIQRGLTTNYLETIKMMVSVGLGWSVLPRTMLDDSLRVLHVEGLVLERVLGVVYHQNRTPTNAGKKFLEILRSHGANRQT